MVDKVALNTCIITLRGQVKRAKLRSITKLGKKIKAFKHGLEKKPDNKKLERKIRKFTEEIEVLKEMDKADNVKKVFSFKKDLVKIIAHVEASAEDRAIAKLIHMNEFLQKAILGAKKKFGLRDDDEEWVKELFTMGNRKQKKTKAMEKTANDSTEESPKKEKKAPKEKAKKVIQKVEEEQNDSSESDDSMESYHSTGSEDEEKASPVPSPKKPKKEQKKNQDKILKMNDKSKKIQKPKQQKNFPAKKNKDFKKLNGDTKKSCNGAPKFKPGGNKGQAGKKQKGGNKGKKNKSGN